MPICKNLSKTDRLLEARTLSFSVAHHKLIDNVSLSLPQGALTVIIGPNGAGKSTLLRLLSGYSPAQSGQCLLHQQPLTAFSATQLAQIRAVMRQHSQLNFPYLAEEIIKMGGYPRNNAEIASYFQQIVTLTDCAELCHKYYHQLSGGEQQRIQLARALLQLWADDMSGKLLFLDEPTSALDLYHQQRCLRLLTTLCSQRGLTVCAILHDLNLASLYADQILLLANGKIVAQGSPQQVITQQLIQQWYQADINLLSHSQTAKPQIEFNR